MNKIPAIPCTVVHKLYINVEIIVSGLAFVFKCHNAFVSHRSTVFKPQLSRQSLPAQQRHGSAHFM